MKKQTLCALLILLLALSLSVSLAEGFAYEHDPRVNPAAMTDIIVDLNSVYGFSPDPLSTRLGSYAEYDWSDADLVAQSQADRIAYHDGMLTMYQMLAEMRSAGRSTEDIARAVSAERNELRLAAYNDDPEGLAKVKESNLATYGNENGPTADSLFEKYGSWDTVLSKAFSSNAGMDACLGLYDEQYANYLFLGSLTGEESEMRWIVREGDTLEIVAQKFYGDAAKADAIRQANADKIGEDGALTAGDELLIP